MKAAHVNAARQIRRADTRWRTAASGAKLSQQNDKSWAERKMSPIWNIHL
ncbi:MAG: hypothetical protein K2W93_01595 [Burkholderiaceae bacterium]|nr:hypothetical protein [Burkholderiaceae bacterium]